MMPRNILALFVIAIAAIEAFQIRSAGKAKGVDNYWESERDLDFRAVICSECPLRSTPPQQCNGCTTNSDCNSDQVCCPFLTLTTTPSACTLEQNTNCRLANTILVDFIRSVCSCVRQVSCCIKPTAVATTTMVTTDTTEESSTATEEATSEATELSTSNSTEEWIAPSSELPTDSTSKATTIAASEDTTVAA